MTNDELQDLMQTLSTVKHFQAGSDLERRALDAAIEALMQIERRAIENA